GPRGPGRRPGQPGGRPPLLTWRIYPLARYHHPTFGRCPAARPGKRAAGAALPRRVPSMARVFKKSITRYLDDRGRQVPKGTAGARRVREKSAKWYGRVPGAPKPVPLCRNKTAAEQMLADLVRKSELAKAGIVDPFEQHSKRPLLEHLADFEAALL